MKEKGILRIIPGGRSDLTRYFDSIELDVDSVEDWRELRGSSMRFLDGNIFIYAYYKPGGRLSERAKWMKEEAKRIIKRINEGESVVTTVSHLSEVNNFLKKALTPESLQKLLFDLHSLDNLEILYISEKSTSQPSQWSLKPEWTQITVWR